MLRWSVVIGLVVDVLAALLVLWFGYHFMYGLSIVLIYLGSLMP